MKTTELIRHWTMSGADRDIAGRFRSDAAVREAITTPGQEERPIVKPGELLVKLAGTDDWAPLAAR